MDAPSFVFHRRTGALPVVDRAQGAVVVNIGHGRADVAAAMAAQAGRAAYVHGTQFTSAVLEEYARRLSVHVPGDCRRLYLVSGGSEETTQEELEEMVALLERALGAAFKGSPAGSAVRPPHAPA